MSTAITLCHPAAPPFPEQIEIADPADRASGRRVRAWSYGGYLLGRRWRRVDWELRHWVAQCLCDRPAHRPRLAELQAAVDARLRAGGWEGRDADDAVRDWVRRCFGDPPPPPGPPEWVDLPLTPSEGEEGEEEEEEEEEEEDEDEEEEEDEEDGGDG